MDAATLPSHSHVKSHGSLLRELGNACTEHFDIDEFQSLKAYLSSQLSDIKVTRPNIPLESFVGLKEVKRAIFQQLEYHGHGDNNWEEQEQNRILLFGAHGTGKSHLVHAIASNLRANLISFETCMVLQKWAENMDMYTKAIYQLCQEKGGRTILFLNHVDIFPLDSEERKRNIVRFIRGVQSAWKKVQEEQEDQEPENYSQLTIFATSYEPNVLDEKLVLSFHQRIYVPTLNFQERKQLFQRMIQKHWKLGHVMQPKDVDWVARRTYAILTSEVDKVVDKATRLQYPEWEEMEKMLESGRRGLGDNSEWRALGIEDFQKVLRGFLVLDSKGFFEFQSFQHKFGTGPFMKIYEREDYDEDGPGKKGKKKNGWVWMAFSWL